MRILHLLQSESFSGAESVACQIITLLSDENELIYASQDGPVREIVEQKGITFFPLKTIDLPHIKKVINEVKPDLIHAHDFTASFFAALLCGDIPVISHIHSNPLWLQRLSIKSFAYAAVLNRIKCVIGVSDVIKKQYIFKRLLEKKFIVLPNVIDPNELCKKAELFDVEEEIDVIYLGRLSQEKNPLKFLEIINQLVERKSELKAVMIGEGDLFGQCKRYIDEHGLNSNVKMYGFLPNPYPYLKKATVIVIPSVYEGFGLVAIEGIILNTIIVCSGAGGLKDIVDDTCGFICEEVHDYIHSIESLLCNKELRNKISKEAINKVKSFTEILKYKNIIEQIYKNKGVFNE